MAMTIGTNSASLTAARSLHESSKTMETAMERLSTGRRINSAGDDAAGLAVALDLQGQAIGLNAAVKNINNGLALTTAIDASLDEVSDMLLRGRELATQAASDNYSNAERTIMHNEMVSLRNEIDALSNRLQFGEKKLLDGSFTGQVIQVGESAGETIAITQESIAMSSIGAQQVTGTALGAELSSANATALAVARTGTLDFEITYTDAAGSSQTTSSNYGNAAADDARAVAIAVNAETGTHGVTATATTRAALVLVADTSGTAGNSNLNLEIGSVEGSLTAVTEFDGSSVAAAVSAINAVSSTTGITAVDGGAANTIHLFDIDGDNIVVRNANDGSTDKSDVTLQQMSTGSVSGSARTLTDQTASADTDTAIVTGLVTLTSAKSFSVTGGGDDAFVAPSTTTNSTTTAVSDASLATQATSRNAISIFDAALNKVATMKADLGAVVNRLGHSLDSAIISRDMAEQGAATIVDADYSVESARLAKAQVQQQVGAAMLAQANAQPQLVLQLVQ